MSDDLADLDTWLTSAEDERLEFKEAKSNYDYYKLSQYACALANEGGGKLILGASDKRPRRVVGSTAFPEPGRTVARLMQALSIRVRAQEIQHPNGRVLIFHVDPRPRGLPVQLDGKCWARSGDELRAMTADELRKIFDEGCRDYSAELHPTATFVDLDLDLIERFRRLWHLKSSNPRLTEISPAQLLEDAELLIDGAPTNAALVLMGTERALGRHLPQAELVFEYRNAEASTGYQQRKEFRRGFLGYLDELWGMIDSRNEITPFRDGFFSIEIPTFNEVVVREALLNALAHRDYHRPESVFVRQFPKRLEIISPGGFPSGITPANMIWRQSPRNRRIAEACQKCGLVERSGQGANRMFEESIRQGKAKPSFAGTDDSQVFLTVHGEVQNPQFLSFLQEVGGERLLSFTTEDLLVLDSVQREEPISDDLRPRLSQLISEGIVEKFGRGRGVKLILSRRLYAHLGKTGAYTRKRGLDRRTNKELLFQHLRDNGDDGAAMKEFQQVLPTLSRRQISGLIEDLRNEGKIYAKGQRRGTRWFIETGRQKNATATEPMQ